MFMKIVSAITVAINKEGKFLLLKDGKSGGWGFPYEEFDGNLNGSLDDTVKRALKIVADLTEQKIDYLGSFLRKEKTRILIGYSFLIENFEGTILPKTYKWLTKNEMEKIKLDKNTLTFLKLNKELVKRFKLIFSKSFFKFSIYIFEKTIDNRPFTVSNSIKIVCSFRNTYNC